MIEARTDAVEHCRHVLAHGRPVWARAAPGHGPRLSHRPEVAPAQTGGRVGEVADQRKDLRSRFRLQRTVEVLDGQMVGVDRDDQIRQPCRRFR